MLVRAHIVGGHHRGFAQGITRVLPADPHVQPVLLVGEDAQQYHLLLDRVEDGEDRVVEVNRVAGEVGGAGDDDPFLGFVA